VLEYALVEQTAVLSPTQLTQLLNITGVEGHLQAAIQLRKQGAQWPRKLQSDGYGWSDELVAYARSQGCSSALQ
jgi:hypothetical protein